MEQRIELGGGEILKQAMMTAHDYLLNARNDVDEVCGRETAAKHPELVAAYMLSAAIDCGTDGDRTTGTGRADGNCRSNHQQRPDA